MIGGEKNGSGKCLSASRESGVGVVQPNRLVNTQKLNHVGKSII